MNVTSHMISPNYPEKERTLGSARPISNLYRQAISVKPSVSLLAVNNKPSDLSTPNTPN